MPESGALHCVSCGEPLPAGARFCAICGTEAAAGPVDALATALTAALQSYASLLGELEAQRISAAEFQQRALATGIVHHDDAIFILDAARRTWHRYDGVTLTDVARLPSAAAHRTAAE